MDNDMTHVGRQVVAAHSEFGNKQFLKKAQTGRCEGRCTEKLYVRNDTSLVVM